MSPVPHLVHGLPSLEVAREECTECSTSVALAQPGHDVLDASCDRARWDQRAVDHQDRKAKGAGGGDLGDGTFAASVLGDNDVNLMVTQQRGVARHIERPARHDRLSLGKGQGAGRRIDQPQKVVMLRLDRKGLKVLATDGQKDALWRAGKGCSGGEDVGDMGPAVTLARHPRRALQRDQGRAGCRAGGDGIGAHLRGEGVGGVDHMGDRLIRKVGPQPFNPAKATHAHVDRLAHWRLGPAGVGVDAGKASVGNGLCHQVRLGRAAEEEDACHG